MSDTQIKLPKDETGAPIERAMGVPICSVKKVGSAAYRDIFDLTSYSHRTFIGIAVYNPDAANSLDIAIGGFGCGVGQRCIRVQPSGFLVFDQQAFGKDFWDEYLGSRALRVRALLSATSGTLATGTINYHNGGSPVIPADKDTVTINGIVYEFSNDLSVTPGNVKVDIGTADVSFSNLVTAINANDSEVTASIDTGTDIVTITSNWGGTDGNAQTLSGSASLTGAGVVVSGANLTGGLNGLQPVIHIF